MKNCSFCVGLAKLQSATMQINLFCIFIFFTSSVVAQVISLPKLSFKKENSQLIEEVIHPLTVQKYEQLWLLPTTNVVDRSKPELVVASYISEIKQGQYERALDYWDPKSKALIVAADKGEGKTKKDWLVEWEKKYKGQNFFIKEQITYGLKYVLIPYYRQPADSSASNILVETLSLRKDGEAWSLTLDLARTPVPSNWMKSGERSQRVSDFMYMSK